jgi:hypothetical protein
MSGRDTPKSENGEEMYADIHPDNEVVTDKVRRDVPPTPDPTVTPVQTSEAEAAQPRRSLHEEVIEALALLAG